MREISALIVLGSAFSFLKSPTTFIIAGLVLAAVILVAGVMLFRSTGKKKQEQSSNNAASNWQPQGQQGNVPPWNPQGIANPGDNQWGQQGQQAANWNTPSFGQQQQGAWNTQSPSQQQPGAWNAPSSQQPGAPMWGAPSAGASVPSAQQPAAWNPQSPQQPSPAWGPQSSAASAGMGANQPQDPWARPQPQSASQWGSGQNNPSTQQPSPAYGATTGQPWNQAAQASPNADPWAATPGQPLQSGPVPQQAAWGQPQQPISSPPAGSGSPAFPSWQPGYPPANYRQDAPASFNNDNDRTMLRGSGPQTALGTVRVEEGKEPGRVYEIRKDSLSIGRSRESDIFLEDLAVSRFHASIITQGNGNYALKDEGSANGTKVNGQLVNKYQVFPLQEGDKIQLGQTILVFAKR